MTRISKAQAAINATAEAELKAAQQAELKRLRAEKRAKARAAQQTKPECVVQRDEALDDIAHADISSMFADLPSPKRVLVGFVLGVMSAGLTGYGIGTILTYALAGIAALTGAAWIAFALSVLAWVIALYAAWKIGGYVGGKVFSSVVLPDGLASRSYESLANAGSDARSKVVGWFGKTKVAAVEQFNGAHTIVKQAIG